MIWEEKKSQTKQCNMFLLEYCHMFSAYSESLLYNWKSLY